MHNNDLNNNKPSRSRMFVFAAATVLFWFSLYTYVPVLPTYSQDMGATPAMVGLIIGSYGFAQMVLRIPFGVLSDRLGKRKIFITGGIVMSLLGAAGLGLSQSSPGLLVSRFLTGVAAAAWVQFTVLFSGYYSREETPKAIGYITAMSNSGQMAAMLVGGAASAAYTGAPFIMACAAAVTALLLSFLIYEKTCSSRVRTSFKQLISVFGEKKLLAASGLAIFSQMAAFATVFAFTPIHARDIGAGSAELGILSTISSFPAIITSILAGGFIVKKIGLRATLVSGFILTAITYAAIPLTITMPQLYAMQFIGGAGRGVLQSMLMSAGIKNISDEKRASAMGFFQAVYSIGMFLGPVLSGAISEVMGYAWGFLFIGVTSLFAGILAYKLIKQ